LTAMPADRVSATAASPCQPPRSCSPGYVLPNADHVALSGRQPDRQQGATATTPDP